MHDDLMRVFLLEAAIAQDRIFDETPANRRRKRGDLAVSTVDLCIAAKAYDHLTTYAGKYLAAEIPKKDKDAIRVMLEDMLGNK